MIRHQSILPWHTQRVPVLLTALIPTRNAARSLLRLRRHLVGAEALRQDERSEKMFAYEMDLGNIPNAFRDALEFPFPNCYRLYVGKWGNRYNFMIGATSEMLRQRRRSALAGMRRRYSDQGAPGRRGSDRAGGMC